MTHLAAVVNTKKLGRADRRRLRSILDDAPFRTIEWVEVPKGAAAKKAAAKALDRGADIVLACGGDGTVRAVAEALVGSESQLGVFPTGTANQFARAMSIPTEPADLLDLLASRQTRTIDTGRCNGMTFLVMAGTGFDAALIDSADDHKDRLGMVAYLRAGSKEVRRREPFQVDVDVDGERAFEGEASCVLVANIGTLSGLEVLPNATPTDGLLDVAVITAAGVKEWASLMVRAVRHRQHFSGRAQLLSGRRIAVRADKKHRFELDGGVKGTAKKFDFEVLPSSLTVCAPAIAESTAVAS
jgi:YegS/Rv2252/BmrU family lipid kinase